MPETTTKQKLRDLLEGDIDRTNYQTVAEATYSSFTTVDQVHEFTNLLEEKLDGASEDEERDLRERIGILSFILGEFPRAVEHLQEVKTRKGASHFLGRVYVEVGRMDEALEALENGRRGEDDFETDVLKVDVLCHRRDFEDARKIVKNYEKDHGEEADWLYAMARVLETEGEYGEALARYQQAVEADPEHRKALFRLALNQDLNGEDERAMELYERCTSLKPTGLGALINLGILYEDHRRFDAAAECYKRVLAMDPAHKRARLYLKDAEASMHMVVDEEHRRMMRKHRETLQLPVGNFEISARSRHVLDKLDVETLGDLAGKSEDDLLDYKNFGETSLDEIRDLLARHNLALGSKQPATAEAADSGKTDVQSEEKMEELDTPVQLMGLSTRSRKCMERLNIATLGELIEHTEEELLATPNFGRTSVAEIKTKLAEYGLSLREEE